MRSLWEGVENACNVKSNLRAETQCTNSRAFRNDYEGRMKCASFVWSLRPGTFISIREVYGCRILVQFRARKNGDPIYRSKSHA